MRLPPEVREQFRAFGRAGGRARAARLSATQRRRIARKAAATRWIRERFGAASFAELGLPGGELVDVGLAALADERTCRESLLVSLAAPRLQREGVPVGRVEESAEERLYELLERDSARLAHARYLAYLQQVVSFADACRTVRAQAASRAA